MQTVLIANRAEIAVRIIRAVHELGWRAVAVHPADDADSLHVALADEAIELPGVGTAAYLDIDAIVAAARSAKATMIHPGYGFVSESAELARRCVADGLIFAGPTTEVLELFGDKARARQHAIDRDVPVLPGTSGPTTLTDAADFASVNGSVMVKAVAGGGGRGMRQVADPAQLAGAYQEASSEALGAFGSGEVYVEKLVVRPRHIEIQIVGDASGAVVALGERDCSIQRRHQKLVEVAPSPWIDAELRSSLTAAALRLVRDIGYVGLGTVEFLVEGDEFWFIETNPRLQVEHTVTEEVTGLDLVATQLQVAVGTSLDALGLGVAPEPRGVAVQVRVNTETLASDGVLLPSSGELSTFAVPTGPGVRVDTYGYAGYRTSPRYDSLLAKVIGHGADLDQATARVRGAVEEFDIGGVDTNLDLLHAVITAPDFTTVAWDTGFIDEHRAALTAHRRPRPITRATADDADESGARRDTAVPAGEVAVTSPYAGVVVALTVDAESIDSEGADTKVVVGAGSVVAVVEAMKMELVVRVSENIEVHGVPVAVGDIVEAGTVLIHGSPTDRAATLPLASDSDVPTGDDGAASQDWSTEVAEIERRRALAMQMGGPDKVARQHQTGRLDARARIDALVDAGSFREIGALAGFGTPEGDATQADFTPANFIAGTARLDGRKVMLGVDDFTLRGGSGDAAIHAKQVFAEQHAGELRLPIVRLLDGASGGGSVKMVIDSGYTYVPVNPGWDAVVDNLSLVPVVAAAVGPTVGLGAARLVMAHLSVMVEGVGQLFTAGPPVVQGGTGEVLTKEELGGADVHRTNGTIERIVADEPTAFATIKRFLSFLPSSVFELPPVIPTDDPDDRIDESLLGVVPRTARHPYEIDAIFGAVFDTGSVMRYADYGAGTITALARLGGYPVGVIAADPLQGATMSAEGALAVTRLVDLCETFHLPIVSLTDQAGMTIGSAAERAATIRHGARAITAIYQARVPQAEVIIRRVYGVGAAGIINRHRASRSWAWPSGDWGSLPSRGGIEAAFRAQLAAAPDPAAEMERLASQIEALSSPFRTAEHFGVQDLIDPRDTRPLLCDWVVDAYRVLPEQLGRPSFGTRP